MQGLWKQIREMGRVEQWALAGVAVFLLLVVIAVAAAPAPEDDKSQAAKAETKAEPAKETEKPEPAAKPEPVKEEPKPEARMDSGEFDVLKQAVSDLNGEIDDFTGQFSTKCAGFFAAGDVVAASDCIDDAYSGVESQIRDTRSYLSVALDKDDLATKCTRRADRFLLRMEQVGDTLSNVKDSGLQLNADRLRRLTKRLDRQTIPYVTSALAMQEACEPKD